MLKLQKKTLLNTIKIPKTMILPISNDNKTEIKKNMKEKKLHSSDHNLYYVIPLF